jgi:hypothetical protein
LRIFRQTLPNVCWFALEDARRWPWPQIHLHQECTVHDDAQPSCDAHGTFENLEAGAAKQVADTRCTAVFAQEAEAKKKAAEEEEKRKSEETKESSADALSEKLNGWFSTLVDKVCCSSGIEPTSSLQREVVVQRCAPMNTRHSRCHPMSCMVSM